MWLLNWLPDWIFYLILLLGILGIVASYVLRAIPFIGTHAMGIQVAGILLTILGVWYAGGIAKDREYRERIAELKLQVAKAEKEAAETNAKIEYVYIDKIKVVKEIQYEILSTIRETSGELDANCTISPAAVEILNRAAKENVGKTK